MKNINWISTKDKLPPTNTIVIADALEATKSAKEHGDFKTLLTLLDLMRYIADIFGEDFSVEVS